MAVAMYSGVLCMDKINIRVWGARSKISSVADSPPRPGMFRSIKITSGARVSH